MAARLLYRVEIVGSVPPGPVIVAANHESLLDPPLLALTARYPLHFLAKVELWRYRPGAWLMDALGGIPIRRDRRDLLSVGRAEELLRAGESVAIFPQGNDSGRCLDARCGQARPRHRRAARARPDHRHEAGALEGPDRASRRSGSIVGEPIPVEQAKPTLAAARALTAELEQRVGAAR